MAARKPSPQELDRILNRGVADIIPRQEFIERLQQAKPLRLKMGFDPSRPDLHIGHVVGLRKLRQLQDLGHELILIVGDWTAQIGDPSGESEMRTMLSAGDVRKNAETYMRQFFKVMDSGKTRAVYQSEWFGKFTLTDVIRLTSHFTVNQFLHRDDFGQRYAAQRPIAVTEMLYPLLQAYDSVAIEADVEFGGTDQLFNLLVGRELQERVGQRPQVVFTMPILPGTDGVRKMSKSLDNYIAIEDTPDDIFGKVMSLPDDVVPLYYELLTDRSDDEVAEVRAAFEEGREGRGSALMDAKKALGAELVAHFYGTEDAASAQAEFERVFQSRQVPTDVPEFAVTDATPGVTAIGCERASVELSRLLVAAGLAVSRSEAARLIDQGAVQIDGERAESDGASIAFGAILRAGRRRFARMVKG